MSRNPFAPSLDQIQPGRGYTPENTKVVTCAYNLAKGEMSEEQFMFLVCSMADSFHRGAP